MSRSQSDKMRLPAQLLALREHLNHPVRLEFYDGEIVEVVLLGVDLERSRDLTYEVVRVERHGAPRARGTQEGNTCVAKLSELISWRPVQ